MRDTLRRQGVINIRRQIGQAPYRGGLGTGFLPTTPLQGTVRGLHIMVNFPNNAATANAAAATSAQFLPQHNLAFYQQLLWEATNPLSMTSYFRENSYNRLNLTGETFLLPAFNAVANVNIAGDGRGNTAVAAMGTIRSFAESVLPGGDNGRTAVASIINQMSNTIGDFSRFDSDSDGKVDLLIVTFPLLNTASAALQAVPPIAATYQADLLRTTANEVSLPLSRALGASGAAVQPITTSSGVVIDSWILVSEEFSLLGSQSNVTTSPQNGMAVYAHETGHQFGLPDLVDESNPPQYLNPAAGAGLFDGMGLGNRNLPDRVSGIASLGFNPLSFLGNIVHISAWGKFAIGWLTPTNVSSPLVNQTLRPIEFFPDCFKLNVNGDTRATEYFLVENRQNIGQFDTALVGTRITPAAGGAAPGTGASQQPIHGLLVWQVNETQIQNSILINQVASDPTLPGLRLIQSDGRDDLRQPLPGIFGGGAGTFDLTTFAFTGFTPTGNDGDDSDPFPGTLRMVHLGDGSDGRAELIDANGLTPANNRASTRTLLGGRSGVIIDSIREQLPAVARTEGGNDILANLTGATLSELTTSTLTVVNPANNDRLENFTPTIAVLYATTHPGGSGGNPLTTSSITLTISGITGAAVDTTFVQNGTAVAVSGVGLGTFTNNGDGTLLFQPPVLPQGSHTVKVTAQNALGQSLSATPITFFLSPRRLRAGLTMISFPYRFTDPPDATRLTDLQPNAPLSSFRFTDLRRSPDGGGSPEVLLGTNPRFARFDLSRFGARALGSTQFANDYHIFTSGRSIVNLDPYIDVVFPGLAYWALIPGGGLVLEIRQARSISPLSNFTVVHEDSYPPPSLTAAQIDPNIATGTLPVFDLTNGRITYTPTTGTTVGWRMIGNPFPFAISYNSMQIRYQGQTMTLSQALAQTPALLSSSFFRLDPNSGTGYTLDIAPNGTLNPFEGVWINFLQPVRVDVAPLRSTTSRALASPAAVNDATNWTMRLSARAAGSEDLHNYLGVRGDAQDGSDNRDIAKAPDYPGNHLRLSLLGSGGSAGRESRAGLRLMQDVRRGPLVGQQRFDFEVETDLTNTEVNLAWDDAGKVPSGYRLTFVDLESGRRLYMRTSTGFAYNSGHGGRRLFRVEVEPDTAADRLRVQSILTSQSADGRQVRISYSLSQTANVQLRVVGASGKVVRRLPVETATRGLNSVLWDGRDDSGRRLPRGLYVIQIVAQTDEQQTGQGVASVALK